MKKSPNRIKTQIDFSTLRGSHNTKLIYTTLTHYNRGGSTGMNASELLVRAFDGYDPTETQDITFFIDAKTRAKAFIEQYGIKEKRGILFAAKEREVIIDTELKNPGKKFFCFDGNDPTVQKMWEILCDMRFRDRAAFINTFLYQYFAHGYSDFYKTLNAELLLAWFKEELELSKRIGMDRFYLVSDMIWRIAKDEGETERMDMNCEDNDIRKLIGLV